MTKFTTLSMHIGDNNHTYGPGETRETDEPGSLQHLLNDEVLGPYDAVAEAAWQKAKDEREEPKTKLDADESVATLSTADAGFGGEVDTLRQERDAARDRADRVTKDWDDARREVEMATQERDAARADLEAANAQIEALTKERDELKAKAASKPGRNA